MPIHLTEDHVNAPLAFDAANGELSFDGPVFAGRYISAAGSTDQTASFIDADTAGGSFALTLRDEDHAAGMHYWIRVDTGPSSLTVQRPASGSTKTINGNFVGQSLSGATSLILLREDGVLRVRPSGDNWLIY